MFQSSHSSVSQQPSVMIDNYVTRLNVVEKFCYLGSVLSRHGNIGDDVTRRIGAASAAFGRLSFVWKERGIERSAKVAVYKAPVLSILIYGCECGQHTGPIFAPHRQLSSALPASHSKSQVAGQRSNSKHRSAHSWHERH